MTESFGAALQARAPGVRVLEREPLSRHTTLQVGGPADWFVDVASVRELRALLESAQASGLPVTLLGGGSNVIVSDDGIRGVVARLRLTTIEQVGPDRVRAEAGVTMNGLVRWMIGRGLAGIEAWAGTPGTVGGAIYGNAHYGGRNIGDRVASVAVASLDGTLSVLRQADMEFAYDTSRLQRTREILVSADFVVAAGEPGLLRETARASLAHRKLTQPLALPSAGCLFQNPDPGRDVLPPGVPASAGALIDRAGLKGRRVGGASISTVHANFLVNDARATARDVWQLAEQARAAVRERFGVELRNEIVFLGQF